ncbi:Lrp/AsnC family transcriptional regulator [Jannaschia rubra]|uniref:Leucine-responsive regulatory protein n=1 Tax=Jannaschia rubra TaxID=282197 RepID=A0A0M6XQD4_9RHOB|nr:Lrp/AsnC family transcriptional regulator [Jannaschia rubra]CTQ32355.1 Leucine-responsive regulatory protein [Jannaschia rubra]SFG46398.1 transcriptional regulator, AsnC family [Jannaschia rubra]
MLDDIDRRILRRWQADPDMTAADLAAAIGLPAATVARRIERLREAGVLRGVHSVIDWTALGYAVEVSLRVQLDKTAPRAFDTFMAAARKVPEVTEMQTFLGRVDLRLTVIARDMAHWQSLYRDAILTLPHIAEIEALMHVATVKTDQTLPI